MSNVTIKFLFAITKVQNSSEFQLLSHSLEYIQLHSRLNQTVPTFISFARLHPLAIAFTAKFTIKPVINSGKFNWSFFCLLRGIQITHSKGYDSQYSPSIWNHRFISNTIIWCAYEKQKIKNKHCPWVCFWSAKRLCISNCVLSVNQCICNCVLGVNH